MRLLVFSVFLHTEVRDFPTLSDTFISEIFILWYTWNLKKVPLSGDSQWLSWEEYFLLSVTPVVCFIVVGGGGGGKALFVRQTKKTKSREMLRGHH